MLPNVIIDVQHNGLGQIATTKDNICGICLTGAAVAGKLEMNKPYAIYSVDDAKKLGIEATGTNADAFRHISEFYASAVNAKLWVIVSPAEITLSQKVDADQDVCPAKILLDKAGGEISVLGVTWTPGAAYEATVENGLDNEVYTTLLKGQLLADAYEKRIMPFVCVVEGRGFNGNENDLKDLSEDSKFRVSVLLASTKTDGSASVGQLLGVLASLSVQRKISRVKNGSLPVGDAGGYLSDGELIDGRDNQLSVIHDKRYIVYRRFPNKSGYFYSGDMTATAQTDDLNCIARVRVMDKAEKITYNTYVEELDDDVEIDISTGELHPAVIAYLKNKIEQQIMGNMTGEISGVTAVIESGQNILSGNPLMIQLSIIPRGYLNPIKVVLGFSNPALSNN